MKIIPLLVLKTNAENPVCVSNRFKIILEKARKGGLLPLTPETLRKRPGLEEISDKDAMAAIDTIKKMAHLLFEVASQNQPTFNDNQQVVCLNQQKRAA